VSSPLTAGSRDVEAVPSLSLPGTLHPEADIAQDLFSDGYFDEAVRKAAQRFINRVRELADRPDLDGVALINAAFSSTSPVLGFNDRSTPAERDEHDGFRDLARGLATGIRNLVTHHDSYGLNAVEAWEWIIFISAMNRRLDDSYQVRDAG